MNDEAQTAPVAEFFRRERHSLLRYVRRLLDDVAEADAEDIVQDVAAGIFHRADFTLPIQNLSAYVYGALRNRIADVLRRNRSHVSLDAEPPHREGRTLAELVRDESVSVESALERRALQATVYEALDRLAGPERAVLIATEFEGLTFRALAEEWNVPLGTLLARKSRALKKVKTFLEASGITSKEVKHA